MALILDVDKSYTPLEAPWEKFAELQIGETENKAKEKLNEFRKFIKDDGRVTCPQGDAFLLRFLRTKNFDIPVAFTLLKRYCKIITTSPKLFKIVPADMEKHVLAQSYGTLMPKKTADGCVVVCAGNIENWNPDELPVKDLIRTNVLFGHYVISDPLVQVSGAIGVIDSKKLSINQIRHITPLLAQKIVKYMQDCIPVKYKAIHIVHNSSAFETLFKMMSPFISKENRELVRLHGNDLASLHKEVDPSLLPSEFGGTLGPMQFQEVNKKVVESFPQIVIRSGSGFNFCMVVVPFADSCFDRGDATEGADNASPPSLLDLEYIPNINVLEVMEVDYDKGKAKNGK